MMKNRELHDFYAPIETKHSGGSTIRWICFSVDECDHCGGEMMAPNSLDLSAPVMGQNRWPDYKALPDDNGGYSDSLGGAVCGACWVA